MDSPPKRESATGEWARWLESEGRVFFLYARQQTRSESDAKDVLQDALFEAWQKRDNQIPEKGLVFAIIRHRAIDLGRSIDSRTRREQNFADRESTWFEPNFNAKETGECLAAAIQNLPDVLREVVVLRIWGEMTFPAIAELTGVPLPTATSRYRYALEQLRKSETLTELKYG